MAHNYKHYYILQINYFYLAVTALQHNQLLGDCEDWPINQAKHCKYKFLNRPFVYIPT